MHTLSQKLDICTPLIKGPFVYLDYPVYGNVGDHLIWMGAQAFLMRNSLAPAAQYSVKNVNGKRAKRHIKECSTICFQGGGNFGDLYPLHQNFREDIIQRFPDKRIVIFPQSIHFQDKEELIKSCAILKKHPDLHILLRDKNSFSILEEQGVPNLYLCPDMAHALFGSYKQTKGNTGSSLYLLRCDKEKGFLPPELEDKQSSSIDWRDLLTGSTKLLYKVGIKSNGLDAKLDNILPAYDAWHFVSKHLIGGALDLFAPYETIVTNRLHAMILATLLGKKAVVYDNNYGKVSSYADLWFEGMENIQVKAPKES